MSIDQSILQESGQQRLRDELKAWEKAFSAANEGRKAGREDIKKDANIAAKYKEYNRLRNREAAERSSSPAPRKRKADQQAPNTPRSKRSQTQTSSKHPSAIDPYDLPQSLQQTPEPMRTAIGPTPQKNGQVLGLFDLLSPSSAKRLATPSKAPITSIALLQQPTPNTFNTPSKSRTTLENAAALAQIATPVRHSRTPQSSAKRKYLDAFLTPSTQRVNILANITPSDRKRISSEGKPIPDPDETPAFLKRFTAPIMRSNSDSALGSRTGTDGNALLGLSRDITYSPVAVRMPRKPIGRSLSQLVRSLREQEDEELDEELDLLRELEGYGPAPTRPAPKRPKLLVQDSQVDVGRDLPLGADGEHDMSEEDEEQTEGNEGRVRKVWKKKGQKRTTRMVRIRPSTVKWQPEPEWARGKDDGVERAEGVRGESREPDEVGETQHLPQVEYDANANNDGSDHYATEDSNNDGDYNGAKSTAKSRSKAKKTGSNAIKTKDVKHTKTKKPKEKEKKPRKISATAHANFRALKIRNKNFKGKGRFGRRR